MSPVRNKTREEFEAWSARRIAVWSDAEASLLADLRDLGVEVATVWDLPKHGDLSSEVVEVLVDHLELRAYPDRVGEGMARAIESKGAKTGRPFWSRLRVEYEAASGFDLRGGLAAALVSISSLERASELGEMVLDDTLGRDRALFLRPLAKFGGVDGIELIAGLREHPVLGIEASSIIAGRERRAQRRQQR